MPGRSSFSSSSRSSRSSFSSPSKSSAPVTPSVSSVPSTSTVQQHNVKVEQPGFFSSVVQGFGLGAGQSFAFNLFRSTPNPTPAPTVAAPTTPITTAPITQNSSLESSLPKEFVKCMKETNNDKEACKHYLD